jgi:hypothetical protein
MCSAPTYRPVVVAAIAASVLMLVSGVTYRVLAARQAAPANRIPIDPGALEGLPLQIGDWTGQDVPLEGAVVDATGSDAHINRRYSRHNGLESVSLFIACGTNVNEVMSHRPAGCYPAAGWQLVDHRPLTLPLDAGINIPCIVYEFYRGGLETEKVTVLHYCFADGQYFNEVMQVLATGLRGLRAIGCAAQVQIVGSDRTLTTDSGTRLVSAFAADSVASIARLFEQIEKDKSPGEHQGPRNRE